VAQSLFEEVGAIQPGIGLGDPGQPGGLALGEVFGVFPQRVAGALELAGMVAPGRTRTDGTRSLMKHLGAISANV
jgi:hypothetical protein